MAAVLFFGFLAFSLLRCSIENSPFFSRNKGKKYSYFREFNFTNWIQFVEICRMNKTTVLNELWTKQNQPIGNNKKIKNKHSPAVSKHPRGLASNEFFEWLLPSSNGLGKSRLDKPQSAAFVILIHYCLNKLDGNPDWRNLEVDDTLKLIANHRTLFRQVNIDARVISFGRTRMESPDAVSYYLEAAAEEIVSKFQENQAKPNLDDILINDIVRWRNLIELLSFFCSSQLNKTAIKGLNQADEKEKAQWLKIV